MFEGVATANRRDRPMHALVDVDLWLKWGSESRLDVELSCAVRFAMAAAYGATCVSYGVVVQLSIRNLQVV